ncbi:uncharacterized protein CC84DRAFT_519888 [Paraphaeosphaeria sporulosa]|uniref:Fungal N-terminal domain-containing protein n=1 Tax=Paraphaeosphaeria sporulosa TaxID=1460663 RepID=A0A177BV65_9PLEO|nr:uncharacterized protein CC84DRAFT_519888 [Paraphaeosphaeria sporulosa]OAF98548.1 hypothetical protein CC84DRAFT_519888 [Paraphaeosphaeria sporulosa]
MAEVLAIVGGVAGGIQMADAFLKLASELRHFIRTVRYAPQQVHQFRRDLSNFSASLRMFGETSEKGLKYLTKPRERKQREKYIAGVFQECEVVKQGFKQLLSRFFEDVIELPSFHGYLDRVRWYLGRTSVAGLKMSLESAKSSITLFLSLHTVEFLHRKIDKLSRKSQEVPQDLVDALRKTERQLKEQRRATRDAHQLLFEYFKANLHSNQAPLVQDIRPIIQETRSIERSTTKTLRKESHRILRQSSSTSTSRYFDDISPSPSSESTAQEPQGPPVIPPAPGHTSISPKNIPSPPTPCSRARTPTARALSPNAGNSPSVSEKTEHMYVPREISSLRDPSPSAISTVRSRSPPIFGPIIRDDDNSYPSPRVRTEIFTT